MRRGEILGLKWEDIDWNNNVLMVRNNLQFIKGEFILTDTKTNAGQRPVKLPPSTSAELKLHQKKQEWYMRTCKSNYKNKDDKGNLIFVCTWEDGRNINPDYVTHTIKTLLEKCDLPDIRFHDLRHTHATLLLQQGVNTKVVSERLGHSKISITLDTYSHVLPNMQQEAADAIDKALFPEKKKE
jgi:integrase